jgi:hypothetical protein
MNEFYQPIRDAMTQSLKDTWVRSLIPSAAEGAC